MAGQGRPLRQRDLKGVQEQVRWQLMINGTWGGETYLCKGWGRWTAQPTGWSMSGEVGRD